MKKQLLFIGNAYHEKTGSADFMVDLLKRDHIVDVCLVDLYEKEPYKKLKYYQGEFDLIVCWQVMPNMILLKKYINYRYAVMFPMADGAPSILKPEKWYPYRRFQFICFSKALYKQLVSAGFSAHYFKYFPAPSIISDWGKLDSAFFWFRREEVNCDLLEKLLESSPIRNIHIHNAADPDEEFKPLTRKEKFNYNYSSWFSNKIELEIKMLESSCYIAPRLKEGIGMSFLEAMGMGRCVIAPDATTMNEYIVHGVNGLLYNPRDPKPLPASDIRKLQENAANSIREGFSYWVASTDEMLVCMIQAPAYLINKIMLRMLIRSFKNPLKVIKSFLNN